MTNPCLSHQPLMSYLILILCQIMLVVKSENVCEANSCNALEKARELRKLQPSRQLKKGGEFEGGDYWEKYESIFAKAWSELPRLHSELYNYDEAFKDNFINEKLRTAVQKLNDRAQGSTNKFFDESLARNLVSESHVVKDVFLVGKNGETNYGLFNKEFSQLLLEELEHLSNSGIPMRRPNGMNRYGAILGKKS